MFEHHAGLVQNASVISSAQREFPVAQTFHQRVHLEQRKPPLSIETFRIIVVVESNQRLVGKKVDSLRVLNASRAITSRIESPGLEVVLW